MYYDYVLFGEFVYFSLTCVKSAVVNRFFKSDPRRDGAAAHLRFVATIMVCFTKRLRWVGNANKSTCMKYIHSGMGTNRNTIHFTQNQINLL